MKTVGLIGGIGPESTIEYYRFIIDGYRSRLGGTGISPVDNQAQDAAATGYPSIIINSIDLTRLIAWMEANELDQAADYLAYEIERLASAGADFGVLASNTPHIVFDRLRARSRIPLISIVDATCNHAQTLALKRVALFGTRFTMRARFYAEVFARNGIDLVVPDKAEQDFIHEKYMNELLKNIFLPETREALLAIVDRMKANEAIDGLILGGTELPLILRRAEHHGVTFLDTTRIHADRIVEELLS